MLACRFPSATLNGIAPGMAAEVEVQFSPDSRVDYEDCLVLETSALVQQPSGSHSGSAATYGVPASSAQATQPPVQGQQQRQRLAVRLLGQRPRPQLTLLPAVDVGVALVGVRIMRELRFRNTGGAGCFCILPAALGLCSFKHALRHQAGSLVAVGRFTVEPSVLDLAAGQEARLLLGFQPQVVGAAAEQLALVCDNGRVLELSLQVRPAVGATRSSATARGMRT